MEITDLTDDLSEGVQSAGQVAKQVDQSLSGARKQAKKVQLGTRSLFAGMKTAWKTFTRSPSPPRKSGDRLSASKLSSDRLESSEERLSVRPDSRLTVEGTTYPTEVDSSDTYGSENAVKSSQTHHAEGIPFKSSASEVTPVENPRYLADDI